jgi:hypothetical protein
MDEPDSRLEMNSSVALTANLMRSLSVAHGKLVWVCDSFNSTAVAKHANVLSYLATKLLGP